LTNLYEMNSSWDPTFDGSHMDPNCLQWSSAAFSLYYLQTVNDVLIYKQPVDYCLFVLGFNVSLTLFQSNFDGTPMRQVIVLPHWSAPVAGTWQVHPTQAHYKLTLGRPAMFPSTRLFMPSTSKGATGTIFLQILVCRGWGQTHNLSYSKWILYHWTTGAGNSL